MQDGGNRKTGFSHPVHVPSMTGAGVIHDGTGGYQHIHDAVLLLAEPSHVWIRQSVPADGFWKQGAGAAARAKGHCTTYAGEQPSPVPGGSS